MEMPFTEIEKMQMQLSLRDDEIVFGHGKFETSLRHLNGDLGQTFRHIYLELHAEGLDGDINLRVISYI